MVTTMEVLMASPIGEELVEYGKVEGRQEGRREGHLEGRLAEARKSLRLLAKARFPGLLDASRAEALSDFGVIEAVFNMIATAPDADYARAELSRLLPDVNSR